MSFYQFHELFINEILLSQFAPIKKRRIKKSVSTSTRSRYNLRTVPRYLKRSNLLSQKRVVKGTSTVNGTRHRKEIKARNDSVCARLNGWGETINKLIIAHERTIVRPIDSREGARNERWKRVSTYFAFEKIYKLRI